ncbi:hypothetical protein SEA_RAHEL_57 [Mycobacterium phage Rahel]|nr:hypothetical protein SEA_RAHEL_57 [Mycobacterium phage Rahel]
MDPNETLGDLRDCIEGQRWDEAAEHFEALDGWLTHGGFLPTDWVRP